MTSLVLMGVLTLGIVLLLLFRPFYLQTKTSKVKREELNASIYKTEFARLEQELRDQQITSQEFDQFVTELQTRLLGDVDLNEKDLTFSSPKKLIAGIAVGVSALAVVMYLQFGAGKSMFQEQNPSLSKAEVEEMVAGLAKRLESDPSNHKGWAMLAKSYMVMRRPLDAERAFEKSMPFIENDPQALAEYADIAANNAGGNFSGKPDQLLQKALKLDPNHVLSLWLAGSSAFGQGKYELAITYWERLVKQLAPGSEDATMIMNSINDARAKLGKPAMDSARENSQKTQGVAIEKSRISGQITVDPKLASQVSDEDALMVIVRGAGSRMPIAVIKVSARQLPYTFSLDDSNAMSPEFKLSSFKEVSIEARISKTGQAQSQSGDLIGELNSVSVGRKDIKITISRIRP